MAAVPERRHYLHGGRWSHGAAAPRGYGRGGPDSDADGTVADNFLSRPPSVLSAPAGKRVDLERLRRDRVYLLHVVCGKFQEVDTYHRGLITSQGFSKALKDLSLSYGEPEVEAILEYCAVTGDGYVIYKELLSALGPSTPRAKQTTANAAIFPQDGRDDASEPSPQQPSSRGSASQALQGPMAGRTEAIRKVYARWERSHLTDAAFRQELIGIGCTPTPEFDRLIATYGPSLSMPFSKLVSALQANEVDGRRARSHHEVGRSEDASRHAGIRTSWEESSTGGAGCETPSRGPSCSEGHEGAVLRQLICGFVDGRLPAVQLRRELSRIGVQITPELERLVRTHESGNCVGFGDFARLLMRQPGAIAEASRGAGGRCFVEGGRAPPGGSLGDFAWGHAEDNKPGPGAGPSALASRRPPPFASDYGGDRPSGDDRRSVGGRSAAAYTAANGCPATPTSAAAPRRPQLDCADESWMPACSSTAAARAAAFGASDGRGPGGRGAAHGALHGTCHGDIIAWGAEQEQTPLPPPAARRPTQEEDFLQWGGLPPDLGDDGKGAMAARFGKRYFAAGPPAGEVAPFGRGTDARPPGPQGPPPSAAPYGTEADRWIHPRDAGTEEYRSAQLVRRPGALR